MAYDWPKALTKINDLVSELRPIGHPQEDADLIIEIERRCEAVRNFINVDRDSNSECKFALDQILSATLAVAGSHADKRPEKIQRVFKAVGKCPELCVSGPAHVGVRYGHALKRSSNMIAKWFLAANHSRTFLPPFSKLRIAR